MAVKDMKPKGGRKAPSGQIVDRLRVALDRALGELDRRGKPLHLHLADAFERDPAKTLQSVRAILPQEIQHSVLDVTALHLQAVRELAKLPALEVSAEPVVVIDADAEPDPLPVNDDHNSAD